MTLGGGSSIVNCAGELVFPVPFSAVDPDPDITFEPKKPCDSHHSYQPDSTIEGSYLSIVRLGLGILDVVALVEASERL